MDTLGNLAQLLASALARTLVNALWQDALLALVGALCFFWLQNRSAMLRHAIGMALLFAMLAAPVLTFIQLWWPAAAPALHTVPRPSSTAAASTAASALVFDSHDWLTSTLTLAWLLGVLTMLIRQLGGWWLVCGLEQQPFTGLPPAWQKQFRMLQDALGISRKVAVRMAAHVVSPFTTHLLNPVIWVPATLLTQLASAQIKALLAHELAHIRRLDWVWNGLQNTVECLLFFHPGMWWLSQRVRIEREHACDDLAVAACGDAIALAEALAALGRQRLSTPRLVLAAHGGILMQRISRLLSSSSPPQRWQVPAGLLVLLCSTALLANQIGFQPHDRITVRVKSTANGPLSPGTYREITADDDGLQRNYRIAMDAQGQITESYKENGQIKPIDNRVRVWLSDVTAIHAPPEPPEPPTAALPPEPPAAPLPPLPPKAPELKDSAAFNELLKIVSVDPGVVALLGSPVQANSDSVHGRLHLWGKDDKTGDARFSLALTGPKGRALVDFSGKSEAGMWRIATLELHPDQTDHVN